MFKPVGSQFEQQRTEQEILKFWDQNQIFQKSIATRDPNKNYVFYEGPPTANGTPGIHHVISRTIKDLVCRYKTMPGYEAIEDPSIYVKLPLKAEPDTYFLVWTTTPATLISNVALALNPDMDYVKVTHQGQKMSRHRGNSVNPFEIIENYGADPLRWYLLTVSPPCLPTRFDEEGIEKVIQRFFGTLTDVYSFFALYANIDKFTGTEPVIPIEQLPQIDRWIISKLNTLIAEIETNRNRFEITKSARMIGNFVIDDLSNWYVRRCRRRFWKPSETGNNSKMGGDKLAAYQTLHHVLLTISKMIAPFIPFTAEELYQNLKIESEHTPESVHLCFYPARSQSEFQYRDRDLEEKMELVLRTVNLGRSLRNEAALKIRQPLQELIICNPRGCQEKLIKGMENLIKEELNVKKIRFTSLYSDLVIRKAEPIYKAIGPKFGKSVNQAAEKIRSLSESALSQLVKENNLNLVIDKENFEITNNDIEIRTENRAGLLVDSEEDLTIALNITLTESLIHEGLARDFVNRVQNMRKDANFSVTDRILIHYEGSDLLQKAIISQAEYIKNETLADQLIPKIGANDHQKEWNINEENALIGIRKCLNFISIFLAT